MAIRINDDFGECWFVLDKDLLLRINRIFTKRFSDNESLNFEVRRISGSDESVLQTKSVDEAIDSNRGTNRITDLTIKINANSLAVSLEFQNSKNYRPPVIYQLTARSDNDTALLFDHELRNFLRSEVAVPPQPPLWRIRSAILTLGFTVAFLIIALTPSSNIQTITATEALTATDIHKKLDYLIQSGLAKKGTSLPEFLGHLSLIVLTVFAIGGLLFTKNVRQTSRVVQYLYPRNLFAFGVNSNRISEAKKLRSNLFWGVGVASIVSIGTGLLLLYK